MEIITVILAISIVFIYIQNYKIKKDVKGLKTLVKVIFKDNYNNDNEIKRPTFPERSDMKPPPSPERSNCSNECGKYMFYVERKKDFFEYNLKFKEDIETKNNNN
jgi:hypothetical protein